MKIEDPIYAKESDARMISQGMIALLGVTEGRSKGHAPYYLTKNLD